MRCDVRSRKFFVLVTTILLRDPHLTPPYHALQIFLSGPLKVARYPPLALCMMQREHVSCIAHRTPPKTKHATFCHDGRRPCKKHMASPPEVGITCFEKIQTDNYIATEEDLKYFKEVKELLLPEPWLKKHHRLQKELVTWLVL